MNRTAGPLLHATLIVGDSAPVVAAYAGLGLHGVADSPITEARARGWGQDALAGRRMVELVGATGQTLLRLIEWPGVAPRPTRLNHGWLALEILVRDVDALAGPARAAGFEIVGAPADLEMSPNIRAMQIVGPAGEMLYLTQVKAQVPPFDLPLSAALPAGQDRQVLGPLFIGVMSVPSRRAAVEVCAGLAPRQVLEFETKVTVLNRAFDLPLETRWPLATVALAGQSLFEIDEVTLAATPPAGVLPPGLAWLTARGPDDSPCGGALRELSPGVWLELVR